MTENRLKRSEIGIQDFLHELVSRMMLIMLTGNFT